MNKGKKGELGTFVVHVHHCENATWQGEVVWANRNMSMKFRSALELLKLIDSALDESGGEGDERGDDSEE